ncbi:hypothetical protein [Streptomyces sp. NPDC089799]|uniref:hypothetical protein n=1 Tax=Streptomyces sp. NPDC089799 TaxID=3155066 RepID=UPI00343DE8D9
MSQNEGGLPEQPGQPHAQPQAQPHAQPRHPQHPQPQAHWGSAWIPPLPPQPGVIPLRPLGTGDVFNGSFATLGRHWKQLTGFLLAVQFAALLAVGALAGLGVALTHSHLDGVFGLDHGQDPAPADLNPVLATFVPLGLVAAVVGVWSLALTSAGLTALLQEAVVGRPVTVRLMFARARQHAWPVAGVWALTGLLAALPVLLVLLVTVPLSIGSDGSDLPVTLFPVAFLLSLPYAAWIGIRFSLAPAAAVCEALGPVTAMRRSVKLVRGNWWRIFGTTLLIGLVSLIIAYFIQFLTGLLGLVLMFPALGLAAGTGADDPASGLLVVIAGYVLISAAGSALGQVFFPTLPQLGTALLYVDQRIRQEDLVSGLLAAAAGVTAGPASGPGTTAGPGTDLRTG